MISLKDKKLIFWDFDGVIKDSVKAKTEAFHELFKNCDDEIVEKIRFHHTQNGGMSRFDKIPLYLKWAGIEPTSQMIEVCCKKFSELALSKVISSPWVPGVREYISSNYKKQTFVLVTATPKIEIDLILKKLDFEKYFKKIYGAPIKKSHAISDYLLTGKFNNGESLMVGDAMTDYDAAKLNAVDFALRWTEEGSKVFEDYDGYYLSCEQEIKLRKSFERSMSR